MAIATPLDFPELYDTIIIAGMVAPGKATVSGVKRSWKIDKKEGKGSDGGTVTIQGKEIPEFEVTFTLWEQEHFEQWEQLQSILENASGAKSSALSISHPALERLRIVNVIVKEIGQLTPSKEGDVISTVKVGFVEYHPAKKAGGTPKKADTGNEDFGPPAPPTAKDDQDKDYDDMKEVWWDAK